MTPHTLDGTAQALVAAGKGILAADESVSTISKRFGALGIPFTAETRRAYREMLFTTPGLSEFVSGVITYDETIRQAGDGGHRLTEMPGLGRRTDGLADGAGTGEWGRTPRWHLVVRTLKDRYAGVGQGPSLFALLGLDLARGLTVGVVRRIRELTYAGFGLAVLGWLTICTAAREPGTRFRAALGARGRHNV